MQRLAGMSADGIMEATQGSPAAQYAEDQAAVAPPPGLEIVDPGIEVNSEFSVATGGKRHGRKHFVVNEFHIHAGGARTHASIMSTTDGAELDHADPGEPADGAGNDEKRILVLFELNWILVYCSKRHHYYDPDGSVQMPNGSCLYIRPGAKELVSLLLNEPRIMFSVVSNMGHWACLPAMRILLEQAIPGTTWLVEESLDGDWQSYKEGGTVFKISGTELSCGRDSADAEDGVDEHRLKLKLFGDKQCQVEWSDGYVRDGKINQDGFLEWKWTRWDADNYNWQQEDVVWSRAGRKATPCLVEQSRREWPRVHIFDRDTACDLMPASTVGKDGWAYYRKDFSKVWSALAESQYGTFGELNTVMVDGKASDETSSHPDNVIPIPLFTDAEDSGQDMALLCKYLQDLAVAKPEEVQDYLHRVPCEAFQASSKTVAAAHSHSSTNYAKRNSIKDTQYTPRNLHTGYL